MAIKVKVEDTILKPIAEVFEAIIDAETITKYFATHSGGNLAEGKNVVWKFEDVGVVLAVLVLKVESNTSISFEWQASGKKAIVDIYLTTQNPDQTNIKITESAFEMTKDGTQKALQQTQGWTDFICSLKAYLYTGINLRNASFSK